jgi:hypothetical protein
VLIIQSVALQRGLSDYTDLQFRHLKNIFPKNHPALENITPQAKKNISVEFFAELILVYFQQISFST